MQSTCIGSEECVVIKNYQ